MEDLLSNEELKIYCRELKNKIKNNKILFINCPQLNIETFEIEVAKNRGYYAYVPTGLQCLHASLMHRNLSIDIFDLNYNFLKKAIFDADFNHENWLEILKDFLKNKDYSVIGVSNLYSLEFPYFKKIIEFLRKEKDCIIISGGPNATYSARQILEEDLCDFICERESENKVNYLFDNLFENKGNKPVKGILFKFNGKIVCTEGENDIVEPKDNLIDSHKILPVEDYCKVGSLNPFSRMTGKDIPFIGILMNRGCRGGCKFCSVRDYMGTGIRSRQVEDVLKEIRYLYYERGIRYFEILDDDFTAFRSRTMELLDGIINEGLKIKWAANNGLIASSLDERILEKMKDSGCIGFKIGVESGNPEILRIVNKPGTIETFKKFSENIQKFPEIFVIDDYIFGFPGETFEKMLESYNFSLEMNLDWSSLTICQPNTEFFGTAITEKGDFVPTKDSIKGKLESKEKIYLGKDVFNIPKESVPSREQLKEIWFVFNLARNFINNKNIKPNGNPGKFIKFVNTIEERYPAHPYINFFLSLANILDNNKEESEKQYYKMIKSLEDEYWRKRFEQFSMDKILEDFPKTPEKVYKTLNFLKEQNG